MTGIVDWTRGGRALAYQRCGGCGTIRYFRRDFCPACGSETSETLAASGNGTVYAVTTVSRAPSPEWKALAPYGIALVDAQEGFRFMAHAAEGLAIGDAVTTTFRDVGDAVIPLVQPAEPS
ncbi:Zn-ribbon domain-containing OB-fold protein [Enterovirga rhinocerotis]|uniref:Putative OB-fold protein n=1 Tax=Enterovirga rhinocerotis TaxID=1339210 RepID=A0A4R7BMN8_9HYPH|nr:OB-fold domain-containing protein [Enterovirga rhinocerotis]TDR85166.1 putative OB-fold protein [Enterovirga rhinocerotis]